jgi:hypothetical protein
MDLRALADVSALLTQPKTAVSWSGWSPRTNHVGHLIGTAALVDSSGITIPGLTMQLEVKEHIVAKSCFYLFSLMQLRGRDRARVYQLEVGPANRRTHNGLVTIHGPHEHLLSEEPTPITDPGVDCDSWDECAAWFLLRTSIVAPSLPNPFKL